MSLVRTADPGANANSGRHRGRAIREELVSLELEAEAHSRSCKAPLGELREQRRIEAEQQEEEARLSCGGGSSA